MKYGLSEITIEKIRGVFDAFPEIETAILYGSRAKGNFKPTSDIDLTLYGDALTPDLRLAIASELDDLLLPYTIDLSIFAELNHAKLREHIERVGVVFYERKKQGAGKKKGWQTKKLGDVCDFEGGSQPPKSEFIYEYKSGYVRFLQIRDFGSDKNITYIPQSKKNRLCNENDILIGRYGASVGKILTNKAGAYNVAIMKTTPNLEVLDQSWFYNYLISDEFQINLLKVADRSAQAGFSRDDIYDFPVPVPPLAEQQRIVGTLNEALDGIATAKANAEKNLRNARALFESHLQSVFTQRGEGWVEKRMSELCDIKHGFAFKSDFFTSEGDYVLLTPGNFNESGGYRDRGEKQKFYSGEIPRGFVLNKGDLLVAMTEQAAGLLGSPILVPESEKFLHNQRLGLVTKKPGIPWTNEFFFHVFNTKAVRKEIHDNASGVKVRHTSPTKIGEVVVSFPTMVSEQRVIVSRLKDLREETQRLESIYHRKLAALDALKKSLMHQAFTGQL